MSQAHQKAWLFVFAHLEETISLSQLADVSGVSKTHAKRIVEWGMSVLKELGVQSYFEAQTNGIIIVIGKSKAQEKPQEPKEDNDLKIAIEEIIAYLNLKTNKNYSSKTQVTQKHISARLKENYTLDDFKKVIDIKCGKWMGTNMEDYLRPITLFGTKFNSYLNERPQEEHTNNQSAIARNIATAQRVADELSNME